jgi:hypothetical protein
MRCILYCSYYRKDGRGLVFTVTILEMVERRCILYCSECIPGRIGRRYNMYCSSSRKGGKEVFAPMECPVLPLDEQEGVTLRNKQSNCWQT